MPRKNKSDGDTEEMLSGSDQQGICLEEEKEVKAEGKEVAREDETTKGISPESSPQGVENSGGVEGKTPEKTQRDDPTEPTQASKLERPFGQRVIKKGPFF